MTRQETYNALRQGIDVGAVDAEDLLGLLYHGLWGAIDKEVLECRGFEQDELSAWLQDWKDKRQAQREKNRALGARNAKS